MKNMGLGDLALVNPRHFPHEEATARASGAEDLLREARVFDTLAHAIADCRYVVGASARPRSIGWPTMTPRECAARATQEARKGTVALVFGSEKAGLTNDELDRCHALVTIPTNPGYSSLNLAMAVQVLCYELRIAVPAEVPGRAERDTPLASAADLERFFVHLEEVLAASGFLDVDNPRFLMRRLRRLFLRSEPDLNEINILRGILASLDPRATSGRAGRGDSAEGRAAVRGGDEAT